MKTPRLYRKLASARQSGLASGGWLSLHAAPDHLLLRKSSGFVETYRRFYFGDIEAITISETVHGVFWNAVFAFGIFFSLLPILLQDPPHIVSGSFIALFTILLIVNVARGTTCRTQLQTRVQTQPLPLRRVRKALRVANELRPRIEAAQAEIAAVAAAPAEVATPRAAVAAAGPAIPPALSDDDESPPLPWIQAITFAGLILGGALAFIAGHKVPLVACVLGFVLLNVGLAVAALIQQRNKRLPKRPGVVVWISLIGHAIVFPIAYGVFTTMASVRKLPPTASATTFAATQPTLYEVVWLPGFVPTLVTYGICCVVLGMIGAGLLATDPSRHQPIGE